MRLHFERVAFRVWMRPKTGKPHLVHTKAGQRLMKLMGQHMAAGRAVDFTQHPPLSEGTDAMTGQNVAHASGVYDQISLTITD